MSGALRTRRLPATSEGIHHGPFGGRERALVALVGVIWGSSFLFIEVALQALHWSTIAAGQLLLGVGTLAVFPAARTPIDRADLPRTALVGVVWMGIPWLLIPLAQRSVDSSVAGILNGSVPVLAAAIAAILLRRRPGRRRQPVRVVVRPWLRSRAWGVLLHLA